MIDTTPSEAAVLSIGVGQRFGLGLKRLGAGLDANGYGGDRFLWDEWPAGCPTHREIPYGFKPWAMKWARDHGYHQALWIDSACVPVKSLDRLWEQLEAEGHIFPHSPLPIGEWCSDACCEAMGMTRQRLMGLRPSMWATVMGLDFRNERANDFLDHWYGYSIDGVSFHADWTNERGQVSSDPRVQGHRHDQTVATILAFELGMGFSWDVVRYDAENIMPLENYEPFLSLPDYPAFILSNHNVKTRPHAR